MFSSCFTSGVRVLLFRRVSFSRSRSRFTLRDFDWLGFQALFKVPFFPEVPFFCRHCGSFDVSVREGNTQSFVYVYWTCRSCAGFDFRTHLGVCFMDGATFRWLAVQKEHGHRRPNEKLMWCVVAKQHTYICYSLLLFSSLLFFLLYASIVIRCDRMFPSVPLN